MNDYDRIERVIRFVDEHHREQPSLSELADVAGCSPAHFHRMFRRWAGVTPKDFLQCLTAEHAKTRLRHSDSVLEAAFASGLSGPGRLHDLLVTLEALTPGEIRNGGRGVEIRWGVADSPFGSCFLGWTDRGLCHLEFVEPDADIDCRRRIRALWPNAGIRPAASEAQRRCREIFGQAKPEASELRLLVKATPFQLKVWRALLQIPEGAVSSYKRIAEAIGSPNASRAVGTACGSNIIGYLIPCHRVIRETGVIKGYRWGEARKKAILAWEGSRRGEV